MSTRSGGRPGLAVTQVLLAMLFLAVIGSTAGYLLGHHDKQRLAAAAARASARAAHPGTGNAPTTGTAQTTDAGTATATPTDTATATPTDGRTHCPAHTEQMAGEPLAQVMYLLTAHSEVWICRTASGTLAYQGHSLDLSRTTGEPGLVETKTALFLWTVERRGNGYYVATNTNPSDGTITEYHVWADKLVLKFRNYASPKPDQTEAAVG